MFILKVILFVIALFVPYLLQQLRKGIVRYFSDNKSFQQWKQGVVKYFTDNKKDEEEEAKKGFTLITNLGNIYFKDLSYKRFIVQKHFSTKAATKYSTAEKAYFIDVCPYTAADNPAILRDIAFFLSSVVSTEEIIFKVNCYGGSFLGFSALYDSLSALRNISNNLTVLIEEAAMSGGYLISAPGNKIVASPSSEVGSIGVISEFFNLSGLYKKLGIESETYYSGSHKRLLSADRENSCLRRAEYLKSIQKAHQSFMQQIKQYRNVALEALESAKVYTTQEALELNLIDQVMDPASYLSVVANEKQLIHVYFKARQEKESLDTQTCATQLHTKASVNNQNT